MPLFSNQLSRDNINELQHLAAKCAANPLMCKDFCTGDFGSFMSKARQTHDNPYAVQQVKDFAMRVCNIPSCKVPCAEPFHSQGRDICVCNGSHQQTYIMHKPKKK
jgi:hypothetical protein